MVLTWLEKYRDLGLLILRLGLGAAFIAHGWPKMMGGVEFWTRMGGMVGAPFLPAFWGFMGAFAEFGGGILLALGLLTRVAAFLLTINMAVALFAVHLRHGDDFNKYSHALEDGVVFLGLIFIGPGRYSLDYLLTRRTGRPGGLEVLPPV